MRLIRDDLAARVNDPADSVSPTSRTVHAAKKDENGFGADDQWSAM